MENYRLAQVEFNLNLEEIAIIARNVRRIKNFSPEEIENILESADIKIKDKAQKIKNLVERLCYSRDFCEDAEIDYSSIQAKDSRLIKAAIADYLLKS